jgi:release factor glutamine methyltransferase
VAEGDRDLAWQVRRHEPARALFAGPTGLEALNAVVSGASARLRPGGWLVLEHGASQGEAVRALLGAAALGNVATFRDLAGRERCTEGAVSA